MSAGHKAAYGYRVPSFFIVGPPRTGTSWLHEILSERTLLPHPTKETRFFDLHFRRGLEWYRAHYPKATDGLPMGEVAPTYFASPEARQRISITAPDARIVCIFRDPVARMLSLYRLKLAYGMIRWSFEEAASRDTELINTSQYVTHLKAWQRDLGREQVLPAIYDDLENDAQSFLNRLLDFIGIPRFDLAHSHHQFVHASEAMTLPRNYYRTKAATALADWLKAWRFDRVVDSVKRSRLQKLFLGGGTSFAEPSPKFIATLYERFRPEVEKLEAILNRDLSAWKISESPEVVAAKKNENSRDAIQASAIQNAALQSPAMQSSAIIRPSRTLSPTVGAADANLVQAQLKAKC
jgi:hypothetical protein